MTNIRRLGQIVQNRIIAEVPDLGGRIYDRADEDTPHPYAVIAAVYGVEEDVECVEADDWTLQISIFDQGTSKLALAALAGQVRSALKGWADNAELAMHALRVGPARLMDDPDGKTTHAVLLVEGLLEG